MLLGIGASSASAQTTVTATWDRNADPYTAGYRVYYGTASGSYQWSLDAGNQVSAPISLSSGSLYYFVVRAYNAQYEYGPPSAEATFDLRTSLPTAQITASMQSATTALVSWQTTNAVSASINGVAVATSGSASVTVTTQTTFTLTATGADGRTATASATVTPTTTTTVPGNPQNLAASVSGSRATLGWQAPASGGTPARYLLYVGTSPGAVNIADGYDVGNVLSVYGDLPRGTYYARVRAANSAGASGPSNEVAFRISRRLRSPSGLTVTWSGTTATLSWTASSADSGQDVPTGYVLEAGTLPGASNVATLNVGRTTTFSAPVTSGNYFVRVRAINDLGESDPSEEIEIRAPGSPDAPAALTSTATGATVDLRWRPSVGRYAATRYLIEVGSAPGLSDVARQDVGDVRRFRITVPPGVYYVRVRGVNATGVSAPSNEVVVRR